VILSRIADRNLALEIRSVQLKAEIGGRIKGVFDLHFIEKFTLPVVLDD
jgi:hypothetical protein